MGLTFIASSYWNKKHQAQLPWCLLNGWNCSDFNDVLLQKSYFNIEFFAILGDWDASTIQPKPNNEQVRKSVERINLAWNKLISKYNAIGNRMSIK
jgi:hypothetical protein